MKSFLFVLLALAAFILFGVSGYQFYTYWQGRVQSEAMYTSLEQTVQTLAPQSTPFGTDHSSEESTLWPEIDFEALAEVNPDIVGWLYCADTVIQYPVVQGEDNTYYLNHLFDGQVNASGCLFLDSRVRGDFTDPHSIIYGHHMKNGSMFSALDGYKEQAYYDTRPTFLLLTPEENYVVELFAGYIADAEEGAWSIEFADADDFAQWLEAAKDRSMFSSPVQPTFSDRILTLSTCSYEFPEARFVVLGILRPAEE